MADEFVSHTVLVEWDERHTRILQCFFQELERNGVRYVILKNDDGLPFKNYSKDVDIIIEPGYYKIASELLRKCYKENGISHYKIHKFERLRCWYGFNPKTKFSIHIDLLEGFLHKGFEMFPFEMIYSHAYKNKNRVYVLDSLLGNVILLMHSTICYHTIKEKYAIRIAKEYKENRQDIDILLQQLLGAKASLKMIQLLKEDDYQAIAANGKWFSHQSKKRILVHRPLFTLVNVIDFLLEKINRLVLNRARYNTFFSVHAPDGTGKTTFIQFLSEQLGFYFVCDANDLTKIYHHRPNILPNLGAAGEKVGVMKQDKNFTVPHRAKPVGFFSSFLRMAYYWVDYVIGMPIILRKDAQFDKITIFDRYIYDFLIDPYRTRIMLPYWIRKAVSRLVKQPRIVFVLDADADTIYTRKQELSKEEIERQLKEFRKLSNIGRRVHFLDATRTPDEMAQEAIKIVIDEFTKKL